ncbi:MAG: agmatine deiminase family protein [Nitrospinaceae bacterium]|nr:MAG: agmatine deiminase family protein [Nitrospinaceae bacterium]
MTERKLPAHLGYFMPAEWEPHAATWMSWPHNPDTWPGQDMNEVEATYYFMVGALSGGERVRILLPDTATAARVRAEAARRGLGSGRVEWLVLPTNDAWIRDYGPNFLVRETPAGREVAFNKWDFDSWGGKYPHDKDNCVGEVLAGRLGLPVFRPALVLEGGAIEVDGQGLCLTTTTCLLNPNRNGGPSRAAMERTLKDYLGVSRVIWLEGGIEGDDTDGHIDNLARFYAPGKVLCAFDEQGPAVHVENYRRLQQEADRGGLEVRPMPLPGPFGPPGEPLPASYLNFYIGNRVVLLPVYGVEADAEAEARLAAAFPGRRVIPVPSQTLIWGLGSIHCLTQQQPQETRASASDF